LLNLKRDKRLHILKSIIILFNNSLIDILNKLLRQIQNASKKNIQSKSKLLAIIYCKAILTI